MRCYIFVFLFLLFSASIHSAIIYVDIVDKSYEDWNGPYSLNLDGQSGTDIVFNHQSWNVGELALLLDFSGGSYHNFSGATECMPITSGTIIGANPNWTISNSVQMNTPWANTPFPIGVDRYIGVKTNNNIYAWVRVQYTLQALIIKDYAYENSGQPIAAGAKPAVTPSNYYLNIVSAQGAGVTTVPESNFMQFHAYLMPNNVDVTNNVAWSVINSFGYAEIGTGGLLHAITQGTTRVRAVHPNSSVVQGLLDITIGPYALSLNEINKDEPLIFPNPAKDNVTIENCTEFNFVQIINLDGKICIEQSINNKIITIKTNYLEQGIYYCVFSGRDSSKIMKLIIN